MQKTYQLKKKIIMMIRWQLWKHPKKGPEKLPTKFPTLENLEASLKKEETLLFHISYLTPLHATLLNVVNNICFSSSPLLANGEAVLDKVNPSPVLLLLLSALHARC